MCVFVYSFCRAMLCISAAYAVAQCLSVRLSVTFMYSVETNKHIFKSFSPSDSHTILVDLIFLPILAHELCMCMSICMYSS